MVKIPDFKLGPTGRFPYGQAGPDDDGELAVALATDHQHGIVRLHFGKPTEWVGLESAVARDLAKLLLEKADELDRRRT